LFEKWPIDASWSLSESDVFVGLVQNVDKHV
jgi:hypothetical protein